MANSSDWLGALAAPAEAETDIAETDTGGSVASSKSRRPASNAAGRKRQDSGAAQRRLPV